MLTLQKKNGEQIQDVQHKYREFQTEKRKEEITSEMT